MSQLFPNNWLTFIVSKPSANHYACAYMSMNA